MIMHGELEAESLQDVVDNIGTILDEYVEAEANADDIATLRVAKHILSQWDREYLFELDDEPNVCPNCAESHSEVQEYTVEDGEKYQSYKYQCLTCAFTWIEYQKYGGTYRWKPLGIMSKWDARAVGTI